MTQFQLVVEENASLKQDNDELRRQLAAGGGSVQSQAGASSAGVSAPLQLTTAQSIDWPDNDMFTRRINELVAPPVQSSVDAAAVIAGRTVNESAGAGGTNRP